MPDKTLAAVNHRSNGGFLVETRAVSLIDRYPYGKAPFALLVIAIVSVGLRVATARRHGERPDLVIATYSDAHYDAYRKAIPRFEREHGVKVQVQQAVRTSTARRASMLVVMH